MYNDISNTPAANYQNDDHHRMLWKVESRREGVLRLLITQPDDGKLLWVRPLLAALGPQCEKQGNQKNDPWHLQTNTFGILSIGGKRSHCRA